MEEWGEQACLHEGSAAVPLQFGPLTFSIQFSELSVSDSETQNLDSSAQRSGGGLAVYLG